MLKRKIKNENTLNLPIAIVLGGTLPHKNLVLTLKNRGYYTVLIDYYENPPASTVCDIHYQESAMDYDVVLEIAKEMNANLVISSCLDQQINIAMKVSEELNLPHPFSSETAEKVTNKRMMKKIMMENNIPTSKYYVVDTNTDLDGIKLEYPIIVKPADGCGSAGVLKLENKEELKNAIVYSSSWSNTSKVIVEEYVTGTEMGVHGYVKDGKFNILCSTCKIVAMKDGIYQQLCNIYLPTLKESLKDKLSEIGNMIVKGFNLPKCTPMFMQVIVNGDKVSVIEFSPRSAGGTTSYFIDNYLGFNMLNYSIDSYVKETSEYSINNITKYVCCYPLFCNEGIFDHIEGDKKLLSEDIVSTVFSLKEPGTVIDKKKPSSSNVMKYLIEGNTPKECFDKLKIAEKETKVLDINGKVMNDNTFSLTEDLLFEKINELI